MKSFKNLKRSTLCALAVSAFCVAVGLILGLVNLIMLLTKDPVSPAAAFLGCADVFVFGYALLYAAVNYNKPHGNEMKMLFLVFAAVLVFRSAILPTGNDGATSVVALFQDLAALLLACAAGRLDKIKRNILLIGASSALLLANAIFTLVHGFEPLPFDLALLYASVSPFLASLALGSAYGARYEAHKAAGLSNDR